MKQPISIILFWVIITILICSCNQRLTQGTVVNKWYEKGHYYTYVEYDIILKMSVTKTIWDDEDYVLILKGFNGKDTIQQRCEVTLKDYINIKVGNNVICK